MRKKAIGMELHSVCNRIMRYMNNNITGSEACIMTGTNGWIIGYLMDNDHRDVYQKDLEESFSITRSTASKVIDLMEQKGLVVRQRVPQDGRLRKLVLTPEARELARLFRKDAEAMEEMLASGFSQEELEALFSYLERIRMNIVPGDAKEDPPICPGPSGPARAGWANKKPKS